MIYCARRLNTQLTVTALMGVLLFFGSKESYAQEVSDGAEKSHHTISYLLDNYKCDITIGGGFGDMGIMQGGINIGYYIEKWDSTQKGIFRGGKYSGKKVLVNAGKGFRSLETGIYYTEHSLHRFKETFHITEQLLVVPITLQTTSPDYFKGYYESFFVSYNIKGLLRSHPSDKKATSLPLNNKKRLFHSVCGGFGISTYFGLYVKAGVEVYLNTPNAFETYSIKDGKSSFFDKELEFPVTIFFRGGLDITILLRKLYGMPFREGPLIMEDKRVNPQ